MAWPKRRKSIVQEYERRFDFEDDRGCASRLWSWANAHGELLALAFLAAIVLLIMIGALTES